MNSHSEIGIVCNRNQIILIVGVFNPELVFGLDAIGEDALNHQDHLVVVDLVIVDDHLFDLVV